MAYAQMLLRDRERLAECRARTLISPLGSGALAGTATRSTGNTWPNSLT